MRLFFLSSLVLIMGISAIAKADTPASPDYPVLPDFPRQHVTDGATIVVYDPQVDRHEDFRKIWGWVAVAVTKSGQEDSVYGAIRFRANIETNFERRTVVISNREIEEIHFPALDDAQSATMRTLLKKTLDREPEVAPLDLLLASLVDTQSEVKSVEVRYQSPKVFVSSEPATLFVSDGDPVYRPVGSGPLQIAANTNRVLIFDPDASRYYLLDGGVWLTNSNFLSPWKLAQELPDAFQHLPDDESWAPVRNAVSPGEVKNLSPRKVFVSTEPAEMIVTDGPPSRQSVQGGDLYFIDNTGRDIFHDAGSGYYYLLAAGRWYQARTLSGPWASVASLPKNFSDIPKDHPKAHVRSSIPGTIEARFAVLQSQIPQMATVKRSEAKLEVTYRGEPSFATIKGTSLSRAVNTKSEVIRTADGRYFACVRGVWFYAHDARGPWEVAIGVPAEIYDIPPSSPIHHVTYVKVYESNNDTVKVGYTSGYRREYISYGVVVYGTGYYYSPFYYGGAYPYYNGYYPYAYGGYDTYNPVTGRYSAHDINKTAENAGTAYGYGYNSRTGAYSQSMAAWNDGEGGLIAESYNPHTDLSTYTEQGKDAYSQWGSTVIEQGGETVTFSHQTTAEGTKGQIETSKGGGGEFAAKDGNRAGKFTSAEGDLYAGANGHVFKKTDEGWARRDGSEWKTIERPGETGQLQTKLKERNTQSGAGATARDSLAGRRDAAGAGRTERRASVGKMGPSLDRNRNRVSSSSTRRQANLSKLNRDARARNYGNRRYRDFERSRRSGGFGSRSGGRGGIGRGSRGGIGGGGRGFRR